MKKLLFLPLIVLLTACGGHNGHNEHGEHQQTSATSEASAATTSLEITDTFRSGFVEVLSAYFELKDALVATNATDAARNATELSVLFDAVNAEGLSAEAAMLWETTGADVIAANGAIISESDVEVQREHFEDLSNAFIDLVKAFGPFENTIYVQTCPMVRGGSADWLSLEENVMNPYHGSRMLRCGSVIDRI
jgi:outer membrane lipopolysaccharide assembly protein LptE/RlpB